MSETNITKPKNESMIYISIGLVCLFAGSIMLMNGKKSDCKDGYEEKDEEEEEEEEQEEEQEYEDDEYEDDEYEDDEYYKERYEISPPKRQNDLKPSLTSSTYCNCGGGIINKNCEDHASRVNSYNNGLNEQTKFKNKNWGVAMPYDNFNNKL